MRDAPNSKNSSASNPGPRIVRERNTTRHPRARHVDPSRHRAETSPRDEHGMTEERTAPHVSMIEGTIAILFSDGPGADCERIREPLIKNLLSLGIVRPDPLRRGLHVTADCALPGAASSWTSPSMCRIRAASPKPGSKPSKQDCSMPWELRFMPDGCRLFSPLP
jgi:hypothetical protein